jgi:RNA polymerase sigma-70 factor (ECF subfamily)
MDDDVSIVRALRARDPRAANALWSRFAPLVFRILRRMVGPGPHNEDIAQEVFLTVLMSLDKLKEPKALGAFIISVTEFAVRDEYRARRRSGRLDRRLGETPHRPFVTTDADSREALLRFATILGRLRPPERLAFALRFVEGQGFSEMASALGVSLATVKRRVKRARDRIAALAERDPILRGYLTTSWLGRSGSMDVEQQGVG